MRIGSSMGDLINYGIVPYDLNYVMAFSIYPTKSNFLGDMSKRNYSIRLQQQ